MYQNIEPWGGNLVMGVVLDGIDDGVNQLGDCLQAL
jgi:hypothetical protein